MNMQQSKNSISTNYVKKKGLIHVTPFDSYNSLTKQRNPGGNSYLISSRKRTNQSLLDPDQPQFGINHLCLKHSLPVSLVCFTCNFQLMCHQCNKQSHSQSPQHDIRSLQKASIFIKNSLIHSQIKLQAKCNILTNINEQITNHKIQLYNQKQDYKQELQKTFQYLHQVLQIKLKQMTEDIQEIYIDNDKTFAQTIQEIKSLQGYYQKCQKNISSNLENNTQVNNQFSICHFYSQKRDIVEDIIKDAELKEFKKQIYQVKYKIQNTQINQIIKSLNDIQVGYDIKYLHYHEEEQAQSRPSSLKKMISKVKSQNQLRIKPSKKKFKKPIKYLDLQKTEKPLYVQSRLEKQRQSHKINGTFCTSTPKENVSRQKKFQMLKKSPDGSMALLKKRKKSFGKMISMPSSPAKQEKQQKLSPSTKHKDQIIQGMKKKPNLTKKKK